MNDEVRKQIIGFLKDAFAAGDIHAIDQYVVADIVSEDYGIDLNGREARELAEAATK